MALVPLAVLALLLPLEPLRPVGTLLGFQVSHLEIAAFALLGASAAGVTWKRPSCKIPLLAPALLLLLTFVLSAAFAEGSSILPWKFTLRMASAFIAFALTSKALAASSRFDLLLLALAAAGAWTAVLALAEAGPWSFDETLVAPFREHSFEVGGHHRVAATFAYPNTAGGFLVLALPPTLYFFTRERARALFAIIALANFTAILLTYSRGALLGAAAAIFSFWWMVRERSIVWLGAAFALVAACFLWIDPSFRWRASSEGDRSWYQADISPLCSKLELEPGELITTPVTIANVGRLTWGSNGARLFHLSYRWFRVAKDETLRPLLFEGEHTRIDEPLAPGGTRRVLATVRAPREPGNYVLIWDMVQEHTTWFSDKVGLGVPVNVAVGAVAAAPSPQSAAIRLAIAERSWRPGRAELWQIAIGLFLGHPLLGAGPDNFRWLYGPASGHAVWDTRVFSNSLYLELLATVGLVGFAAFALLVGSALAGLLRASSLVASALAASLSGFLVHGLFDYLLAFTPIYLAVFLILGASSAAIREEALR